MSKNESQTISYGSMSCRVLESHIDENGHTIITKFEPMSVTPIILQNHDPNLSLGKFSDEEINNILDNMMIRGKFVPFSDKRPKTKYTEEEMKMALTYQWASKEPATIEQIDKMLNESGTNE